MKKFRPYNAGFIFLYALSFAALVDVVYTLIAMRTKPDSFASSFALWSFLIFIGAFFFVRQYVQTRVEVGSSHVHIVRMALIAPKPGAKRVNFLFRQGNQDNILINLKFPIDQLEKYAYVEEFGLKNQDKSGASPKNKLFPLHEVSFILKDGKDYRLNLAIYSRKQRREMIGLIQERSGIAPTGKLAEVLA